MSEVVSLTALLVTGALASNAWRIHLRNTKWKTLRWPKDMDKRQFRKVATVYFRSNGWTTRQSLNFLGELTIIKNATKICVVFVSYGETAFYDSEKIAYDLIVSKNLLERPGFGRPLFVSDYLLSDWQLEEIRSSSVLLLHFSELDTLDNALIKM